MAEPLSELLRTGRALYGIWVASGDPVCAEICAASGLDWVIVDTEHAPNDLRSVLAQLQAVSGYPVHPMVRPSSGDPVLIKQLLDIGVTNLLVPMVESADQAEAIACAVSYPPRGIRGIGATLARSSRWGLDTNYFAHADRDVTLFVQAESTAALAELSEIAAVDGIDGIFLGPADLAGSMGLLGQACHPDVVAAVESAIRTITQLGKLAGVNAFDEKLARRYHDAGAKLISVGADVTLIAKGAKLLATTYIDAS